MSDDPKTREQLLAEIETLKRELEQRDAAAGKPGSAAAQPSAPIFAVPVTRRESLTAWVAPVILALPVVQGLGMALYTGKAYAGDDSSSGSAPLPTVATIAPSVRAPTHAATVAPSSPPPTQAPTAAPTATPTHAGRCIIAPTAAPVASPTLGAGAAPDSRPCPFGFVALGGARAMARQLGS